jgi:hypothetical protein
MDDQTRSFSNYIQLSVCHQDCHFKKTVFFQVQTCHLTINPQDVVLTQLSHASRDQIEKVLILKSNFNRYFGFCFTLILPKRCYYVSTQTLQCIFHFLNSKLTIICFPKVFNCLKIV